MTRIEDAPVTPLLRFYQLARLLSFTDAAQECRCSRPTVVKDLQKLEGYLGCTLILRKRGSNMLRLTDAGHEALAHATEVRSRLQLLEDCMRKYRERP